MTTCNKLFSISAILIAIILLIAVLWLFSAFSACAQSGSSFVLIDADSGIVLEGDNKDMRLEEASTTKVMTALVALQKLDMDEIVQVGKDSVGIEGSSVYLKEGEKISVRTLLYGLMLRSGNDAAHALAVAACGSEQAFVDAMNAKTQELGLQNTHFVNPHGLHAEGHYTSAYDLAMIAREAMSDPVFAEIVASKSYKSEDERESEKHVFYNKNKLLSSFDGANGIKTGYTTASGKCFVGAAKRDGMQLICVVLNRPDMWDKSKALLQYGFDNYRSVTLGRADAPFADYEYDGERVTLALADDVKLPVAKDGGEEIGYEFVPSDGYPERIESGECVGTLRFLSGKRLLFEQKIVTIRAITKKGAISSLSRLVCDEGISNWKDSTNISPPAASPRAETLTS